MQNSVFTVLSATIGGLSKAFTIGFVPASITLTQINEVAVYAAISATIGYTLKLFFDWIKRTIKRRINKNKES